MQICIELKFAWPLKMGLIGCPKVVSSYQHMLCNILEQQRPQDATTYTIWGNTSILKQGSWDCSFGQGGAFHRDTQSLCYDWILWNTPSMSCEIKIPITVPNWNSQQRNYTSGMSSVWNDMCNPVWVAAVCHCDRVTYVAVHVWRISLSVGYLLELLRECLVFPLIL